jgi:hypothetical protein
MCPGSARHFLHPVILVGCRSSLLRRPAACGCAIACPGRVHNRPHARTPLPATTDSRGVPRHLLHRPRREQTQPGARSQLSYARTYHLGNRSTRLLAHNARRFPCCVPGWAPWAPARQLFQGSCNGRTHSALRFAVDWFRVLIPGSHSDTSATSGRIKTLPSQITIWARP